jgi:hypothetical protein
VHTIIFNIRDNNATVTQNVPVAYLSWETLMGRKMKMMWPLVPVLTKRMTWVWMALMLSS